MKKKRYTTEQMISILKECEATGNISEVCRKHGIAATTFYSWKATKRLKELELENAKLKRLLGEAALDNAALKDLLGRKWWARRQGARRWAS